jgi:hypothetical protein
MYNEGWGKHELEFSIILGLIIENSDLTGRKFSVKFFLIFTAIKWGDCSMAKIETPFSLR